MVTTGIAYLLLLSAVGLLTVSQLLIKYRFTILVGDEPGMRSFGHNLSLALSDPLLWLAGVLIVSSAACWYLAMSRLPVSFMLPVGASVAPLVAIGAYFLLGENLSVSKIAAIAMIAIGVAWLGHLQA